MPMNKYRFGRGSCHDLVVGYMCSMCHYLLYNYGAISHSCELMYLFHKGRWVEWKSEALLRGLLAKRCSKGGVRIQIEHDHGDKHTSAVNQSCRFILRTKHELPKYGRGKGNNCNAHQKEQVDRQEETVGASDMAAYAVMIDPEDADFYPLTLLSLCLSCSRLTCVEERVLWRAGVPCCVACPR